MKTILTAAFLTALAVLTAKALQACDCAAPPPPAKALEQSAAVFLGQVATVVDQGNGTNLVTLDVEGWWKGGDTPRTQVVTSKSGASCGFHFAVGERYLVYAHGKAAPLEASLCSRTRDAKRAVADGDIKDLGPSKAPKAK